MGVVIVYLIVGNFDGWNQFTDVLGLFGGLFLFAAWVESKNSLEQYPGYLQAKKEFDSTAGYNEDDTDED